MYLTAGILRCCYLDVVAFYSSHILNLAELSELVDSQFIVLRDVFLDHGQNNAMEAKTNLVLSVWKISYSISNT